MGCYEGSLFPPLTAANILGLDRPRMQIDDFIYWRFTRDGAFSTKSAYAHLISQLLATSTAMPSI